MIDDIISFGVIELYNEEQSDVRVFTDNKDLTLTNIKEMVDDNDLITNPDYQRDYVYNDGQASRLVESILIDIPIPVIYLCEENDGRYTVIDGQQRLTSLVRYLKNEFALKSLEVLTHLNGKYYKDLEKLYQRKLKTSTLKAICLKKESQDLKYEIFARLNQGSVSLKPQELRNCIYRGSFNNMLEVLAKDKLLSDLFHDENVRKTYQERILRFFALRDFQNFKSSILKTLNDHMHQNQHLAEDKIENLKSLYRGTMDIIKQVLGEKAFCAYDREKKEVVYKFSGSVYDSIAIPFSIFSKHDLISHADQIRKQIEELKVNNQQYQEDTYAATGSRKRVIGRIMAVYNLLSSITGNYGGYSESRAFSNEVKEQLFHEGYICSYCNNTILSSSDAEVDHIVPFSQGGRTDISNAQLLHRYCNRKKNDAIIDVNQDLWEDEESSAC